MDAAIRATQAIHMISPTGNLELLNNRHALFFLQLSFDEMKKTTIMTAKLVALETLGSTRFWVVRMATAVTCTEA